jgi:hypothetical protein
MSLKCPNSFSSSTRKEQCLAKLITGCSLPGVYRKKDIGKVSDHVLLFCRFDHNIKLQDHRMEDKDFIYGQITVKIEEIKQQNAKLLTQAQQLHLEHDFQNRLCSTGCKFLVLTSRHEIGVDWPSGEQ